MGSLDTAAAHRASRWAAVVVSSALLLGVAGCGSGSGPTEQADAPVVPAGQDAAQPAVESAGGGAENQPPAETTTDSEALAEFAGVVRPPLAEAARPVRVLMPRLKIDAILDPLRLDSERVLIPPKYGRAGWYAAGPEPGEAGRAVVAGHVDSKTGPDVFAALNRARTGDRIVVKLADGSTLRFVVERVEAHAQKRFPTAQVYGGPKKRAEIRLITCTGDYVNGRYQDNLIVFGTLVR